MHVKFHNITNQKIKDAFIHVFSSYKGLHKYTIHIKQKKLGSSTMRAQPKITLANLLSRADTYEITMGVFVFDTDVRIESLPKEVIEGWFAHELGHIVDYEQYSTPKMLLYGLKYIISHSFKKKVEHEADYIAIKRGFRDEIIATKKFLLTEGLFSDKYQAKLEKYYLPLRKLKEAPAKTLTTIYHE